MDVLNQQLSRESVAASLLFEPICKTNNNLGNSMTRFSALGIAFCLCAASAAAAAADTASDVVVGASFRAAFGASGRAVYAFQGGSSLTLPDELKPFQNLQSLPLSGISYAPGNGLSPVLLGIPVSEPASSRGVAEGDSGLPWAWIGAGAAVIAGLALAGGSDKSDDDDVRAGSGEGRRSSGVTDENTCVMGQDGAPPDVDADCARYPHGPL